MRALGLILAGGNNHRMWELTHKRSLAVMPVAGSYRAIDFVLSNMSYSNIQKVGVLAQYNSRSMTDHLNSASWWDFGRKQGGLQIFTPSTGPQNNSWYRGSADAIYQNIEWLKQSHEPYVIMASDHGIYKLDFNKVLDYHIAKKADITIVCKEMPIGTDMSRFGVIRTDEDGRITDFEEKPIETDAITVSCGIYVIRRRLLVELIEKSAQDDRCDFVQDILIRYKNVKKIYAYPMESYWNAIASVKSYYDINMDFLKKDVQKDFLRQKPQILSKVLDEPPAKYNTGAVVKNSLIANGSIVNGTVENSVLFRKVFIGNNCVIKNSIILNNAYIGDNTYIENCIVESRGTIRANSRFVGETGVMIVSEKNERHTF